MVLDLVLGFLVLVAASYVGTTLALRGFFGRERYDPTDRSESDGPPDDAPKADGVPSASDVTGDDREDG